MSGVEQAEAARRVGIVEMAAVGRAETRDVGALETLEDGMGDAGVARHMRPRGSSQREHPSTVA